jgi:hypothetical protein
LTNSDNVTTDWIRWKRLLKNHENEVGNARTLRNH